MVETLDMSDRAEAQGVLQQAFATHPILPPGTPLKTTAALLKLILDTFGNSDRAYLHGIRSDGELACVSFALAAGTEPKGLALAGFTTRLFGILGWRLTREFSRALSGQPQYEQPYLDLMLIGTLPSHQGQGLGRELLEFLYGFAEGQGYQGLTLGVTKDTPAYHLYVKEGFVVDAEVPFAGLPLCHMRRDGGG